jgi:hypothetical protein
MKLETLTGLMGDALKSLSAQSLDDRTVRLYGDAIVDRFKATTDWQDAARELAQAVLNDEKNDGGLLSRNTLHRATAVLRDAGRKPRL